MPVFTTPFRITSVKEAKDWWSGNDIVQNMLEHDASLWFMNERLNYGIVPRCDFLVAQPVASGFYARNQINKSLNMFSTWNYATASQAALHKMTYDDYLTA